jgi:hypothetical protein
MGSVGRRIGRVGRRALPVAGFRCATRNKVREQGADELSRSPFVAVRATPPIPPSPPSPPSPPIPPSPPLRRLKIATAFVRDIGHPAAEAIIAMARSLGLQAMAEGVEREDQATFLRDAGCDIGQGYLYGRPAPAEEPLDRVGPG